MPPSVLIVETRPASPEQEEAFSRWYDDVHLAEVVALPGVRSATRYRAADGTSVAVYDLDADDPSSVLRTLGEAMADGRIQLSDALQMDPPPVARVLEQVSRLPTS